MTDNEKAATCLGWKPGQKCSEDTCAAWHPKMRHPSSPHTPTDIPAPDMTKPKNYMKAVEILIHKLKLIEIHEGGYHEGDPYVVTIKDCWVGDKSYTGVSTNSLGEAFVKVLADYYKKRK